MLQNSQRKKKKKTTTYNDEDVLFYSLNTSNGRPMDYMYAKVSS